MNKTYLITYDLSKPGQKYEELLRKIKSYPGWSRLGGSAYIILTPNNPVEIRSFLTTDLDRNDKLFVGVISAPAAWTNLGEEVSLWLNNNLK